MNSKVTEEVSLTVPSSNTPSTRKSTFLPSQNWTSLQKSLPKAPSKKRKREAERASKKSKKSKNPVKLIKQTTYNPWRPNDSSFRGNGNSALILHTESTDKIVKPGRYVAMDCEMVGVGADGVEDALARVTIVNYFGHLLLDAFVAPTQRVIDWRTKYSGIRPADLLNPSAQSFSAVQTRVAELIKDRILVGHGVQGDLAILKLSHPREKIRDTSLYEPFRAKYSAGKIPSLKKVVEGELGVMIQSTEHDSIEDAQAVMALFRVIREEYEKAIRMGHLTGLRPKVENIPIADATEEPKAETKPEILPTGSNSVRLRKRRKSKVE